MSKIDREKWNTRYREGAYAERTQPSVLLQDWIEKIAPGRALDVACGAGRNALFLAERGFDVDAVDVSAEALDRARAAAQRAGLHVNWCERDLDAQLALSHVYQLILMVRYVNLPLMRQLTAHLAPGGFLICEQHLATDAQVIGPTNPAFRVRPDDLRAAAGTLRVLELEESVINDPDGRPVALARLVAERGQFTQFQQHIK